MAKSKESGKYPNPYTVFVKNVLLPLKDSNQSPVNFFEKVSRAVCPTAVYEYNTWKAIWEQQRDDRSLALLLLENNSKADFKKYVDGKREDPKIVISEALSTDDHPVSPDSLVDELWSDLKKVLRSYLSTGYSKRPVLLNEVQKPDIILGREKDARDIAEYIRTHSVTYLQGESGIGKSTLINHIISNKLTGDKVFRIPFPAFQDDPGQAFINSIAQLEYRGAQHKEQDLYKDFIERMRSLLSFDTLVFDNFDSEYSLTRMFSRIDEALKQIDDGIYCLDNLSKRVKLVFVSRQSFGSRSIPLKPLDEEYQWQLILNGTDRDALSEWKKDAYGELIKWTEGNTYILALLGKVINSPDNTHPVDVFYNQFIQSSHLSKQHTEVLSSKAGCIYDAKIIFDFMKELYVTDILSVGEINALKLMALAGSSGFYRQYYVYQDGKTENAAERLWGSIDISDDCIERLKNLSLIRLLKDGVSQNQKVYVHSIVRTMVQDPAFSCDDAFYSHLINNVIHTYRQALPHPLLRSIASILSHRKRMIAGSMDQETTRTAENIGILSALGVIYGKLGDFNKMIECETDAVNLIKKDDHRNLAAAYNQLSLSYARIADTDNCLKYIDLAYQELEAADDASLIDYRTISLYQNNRIYAYGKAGRYKEQQRYAQEALSFIEGHPEDPFWQHSRYEKVYSNLASGYANAVDPDYDEAIRAAQKAIDSILLNIESLTTLNNAEKKGDPSAKQKLGSISTQSGSGLNDLINTLQFRLLQERRHIAQFYAAKADPGSLVKAEQFLTDAEKTITDSDLGYYIDTEKLNLETVEIMLTRLIVDLVQNDFGEDLPGRMLEIISIMNNEKHTLMKSAPVLDGKVRVMFRKTNNSGLIYCYDDNVSGFSEMIDRSDHFLNTMILGIEGCSELALFNNSDAEFSELSKSLSIDTGKLLGVFEKEDFSAD